MLINPGLYILHFGSYCQIAIPKSMSIHTVNINNSFFPTYSPTSGIVNLFIFVNLTGKN